MKRQRNEKTIESAAVAIYHSLLDCTIEQLQARKIQVTRQLQSSHASVSATDKWASDEEDSDEEARKKKKKKKKKQKKGETDGTDNGGGSSNGTSATRSVERYSKMSALGEGQFGTVFLARDTITKNLCALKQIKLTENITGGEGFPTSALREINVLQSLRHPNIIRVHDVVVGTTTDQIYIVMEYVSCELGTLMVSMGESTFTMAEAKCLLSQLLDAVSYMHARLLVHRDIKPTNILYHSSSSSSSSSSTGDNNHGRLVLCDFGLSCRISKPKGGHLTPLVVTLYYRAVEILLGDDQYDESIDMWSVGCVFAELLTNKVLLPGKGEIDQLSKIFNVVGGPTIEEEKILCKHSNSKSMNWEEIRRNQSTLPKLIGQVPEGGEDCVDLLRGLLRYDATVRLTAEEAKKHHFLTSSPLPTEMANMPKFIRSDAHKE